MTHTSCAAAKGPYFHSYILAALAQVIPVSCSQFVEYEPLAVLRVEL